MLGVVFGLWLALSASASALLDPYIKALNSMPRVILAPIFAVWFGLGIWSKVLLGVTLGAKGGRVGPLALLALGPGKVRLAGVVEGRSFGVG